MEQIKSFKIEEIKKIIESKQTEEILEYIKSLEEIGITSIGKGRNADVYAAFETKFNKVCVKKVKEKPELVFNDINKEHEYQSMAHKAGVCTPLSLVSIKTEKEELIIMERIEGYSVRDVLNNPKLIPKNFNYEKFCKSLDEQISKMHSIGLYHRDLHDDNVMIDEEGLPVIIDFGTAKEASGGELTYRDSVSIYNGREGRYESKENIFDDDLYSIKKIKNSLRKFR